ncbi:MAG: hypothetical protein ACXVHB_17420 [Solirubrobacteraceae bacterium]
MTRARCATSKRTLDPIAMAEARKEPNVFVELDTRQEAGYTVSLEWDRRTGNTQIVVADVLTADRLAFLVPGANAADALRDPLRYAA